MRYDLRTSTDFGITYCIVDTGKSIDELIVKAISLIDRRWVITDKSNNPVRWCSYVNNAISIPDGYTIASDDPYVIILAKKKNIKVLRTEDLVKKMKSDNIKEHKGEFKLNKKEVLEKLDDLIAKGMIQVLPEKK